MKKNIIILKIQVCVLSLFIMSHSYAAVFYVTPSGAGAMNGTSWGNSAPGSNLQSIITAAVTNDEVWVAAGTYYTTTGTNRSASFNMKNGVGIYGSFTGTETALSQRTLSNGLSSILSAEIGLPGISDNSYHTIHNTGLTATAIIDGFIIKDGNDNRPATGNDGLGGGIFNDGSNGVCSPTIRNCVIINNQAVFGGGIFNSGNLGVSNPVIMNCVIAFNNATTGGGGIDNFGLAGNANPTITNCIIYSNTATQRAGGMYCWGGNNGNANPVVLNSAFVNNSAIDGGGVVSDNSNTFSGNSGNSNPDFKNCIFWGNTASGIGPQFFILGTGTFNATYSDINTAQQISPHTISGSGTGNINTDPLFVNATLASGNDAQWLTGDDGLQLQGNSPCVNTGTNSGISTFDILARPRTVSGITDMGPYEDQGVSTSVEVGVSGTDLLHIYPNPSIGVFTVSFNSAINSLSYEIVDVSGKLITKGSLSHGPNTIILGSLESGIYFFKTSLSVSQIVIE